MQNEKKRVDGLPEKFVCVCESLGARDLHLTRRDLRIPALFPEPTTMAEHRAKKSGLGADIDRKMESRYDEVEAAGTINAVVIWLNAVVGNDHEQI
ncbi:transgelin-like protein-2, partial [Plakobranchus ocellatus]